jgi:hypothetical protein
MGELVSHRIILEALTTSQDSADIYGFLSALTTSFDMIPLSPPLSVRATFPTKCVQQLKFHFEEFKTFANQDLCCCDYYGGMVLGVQSHAIVHFFPEFFLFVFECCDRIRYIDKKTLVEFVCEYFGPFKRCFVTDIIIPASRGVEVTEEELMGDGVLESIKIC